MDGRMIEKTTIVQIWADQNGGVHADFNFHDIDRLTGLKVNLRLDQLKLTLLEGFEDDRGDRPGQMGMPITEVPIG